MNTKELVKQLGTQNMSKEDQRTLEYFLEKELPKRVPVGFYELGIKEKENGLFVDVFLSNGDVLTFELTRN